MRRKLIKQGGGGYTIYLPKKWVDVRGLQGGDHVTVSENDARLIIAAEGSTYRETTLNISGEPRQFIRMKLMNIYRLGYDRVSIQYASATQRKIVEDILDELLGFAVIHDAGDRLTIEGISEPSSEKYSAIVLRLLYLFKEILDNINNLPTVEKLTREAYRYDHFCKRTISKQRLQDENATLLWAFHLQMIHAIKDSLFLSRNFSDAGSCVDHAKQLLGMLMRAYQKKDRDILLGIYEYRDFIFTKGHEALRQNDPVAVHYALDIVRNIYLAASPLFSMLS